MKLSINMEKSRNPKWTLAWTLLLCSSLGLGCSSRSQEREKGEAAQASPAQPAPLVQSVQSAQPVQPVSSGAEAAPTITRAISASDSPSLQASVARDGISGDTGCDLPPHEPAVDGSFEFCSAASDNVYNSNISGGGFVKSAGSPDSWISPMPTTGTDLTTPWRGIADGMPSSPDGGIFIGGWPYPNETGESFYVNVSGLTVGKPYTIKFYQGNAGIEGATPVGALTRWSVRFGSERKFSHEMPYLGEGKQVWEPVSLVFTPTSTTQRLEFLSAVGSDGLLNSKNEYMALDGIQVLQGKCEPKTELVVKGTDVWLDTGLDLKPGDQVVITATGQWRNDGKEHTYWVGADGFGTYKHPDATVPSANFASLIGRVGDSGEPFFVGSNFGPSSPGSGRLFLQMNDIESLFPDNEGELRVTIEIK